MTELSVEQKALAVIENIVSDDWAEYINMDAHLSKIPATREMFVKAADKIAEIYLILHSINKKHSCYNVHNDWRQMLEDKYNELHKEKDND